MSDAHDASGRYRAAPVGQEPGEIWYGVFLGTRMVSGRVMRQDEAEKEADRMNAEALTAQPPEDAPYPE
ncbi:MAG TPA: hypothetical protein VL752_18130 [Acidisoma sp.]|jgi:hypothetical protein|uniref:hypothetical protein n=1 Tax=Acidisoma sp. TaxID=1872115 RepID=UPI002B78496C|nr:hypothetical protein [Acidisoma sp.]HTI02870.1 hypothetical protein [Acidisoma sp.]